ncbi:exonuclease SbcCD subunit D [candidate division WWE3 bacterium CG06_land_8_20_14_3_00_42_16]|uniref:Nuclease SbcCD subunit D n=1 Tax=candidate division WWE3 bacterium CG06_land_8_20_14_3_00_42_16 TaxID=1975083 RepID=A0A2M7AMH4_UNCKA|nr:MAG: exonuclease SbcCD subunit D [candidate division WWE3 bacterium CG06_land_8_20_14_3_00_42_16]
MKLIHFADLHLGMENYGKTDPESGLSTRLLDFLRSFDFMVDYALEGKVDAVLFAGDAYKNREPTQTHQREFAKRILKLSKNQIPVVLLVGNHDTPNVASKANTLDIYSTLEMDNVFVIRTLQLVEIPLHNAEFAKLQVIGLPWLSRKEFEHLAQTLPVLYKNIKPEYPTVTVVHGTVEGAVYGSERALTLGKDPILPLPLLTHPAVSYVALGHIHKRQILSQDPPTLYSGSLERVDFGEEKEEKSFELVEINDQKKAKHQPILTPARRFLTLNFDLLGESFDPTEKILKVAQKSDLTETIVKVVLNISTENLERLRVAEIKKAIEEKAHLLAGITKNVERSVRQRLEGVSAETLSPLQALQIYFEAKEYPKEKIKVLEKYGRELMEEFKEIAG